MAVPVDPTALELPWRLALEQGWGAFRAGNPPVGAVITNAQGAVVARGRRIGEDPARRAEFSALPLFDAIGLILDQF
ncbi:hypothetical protein ABZ413_07530 [Nocardia rhamnosiphila]|uniref:hypothetical protein n=1 Tax=Nocardia rhamnosiphila TaxID=426716 RepID=UPI0033DC8FAB